MRFYELSESVSENFLFHGTSLINAIGILSSGKIEKTGQYEGQPVGVSMTRNYTIAHEFGTYWERQYSTVFVFDRNKLKQKYKIIPYRDFDPDGNYRHNEYEEVVLGDVDLSALVSININPAELSAAYHDTNWQKDSANSDEDAQFIKTCLKKIANDPRTNAWTHRFHTKHHKQPSPVINYLAKYWYKDYGYYYRNDKREGVAKIISDDTLEVYLLPKDINKLSNLIKEAAKYDVKIKLRTMPF